MENDLRCGRPDREEGFVKVASAVVEEEKILPGLYPRADDRRR
jgi:hypothetical protein